MSGMNTSELFIELTEEQLIQLVGGADFELSGSNYANRLANNQRTTTTSPTGSIGNSTNTTSAVNTAAQNVLGLGVASIPSFRALGAAPVL